MRRVEDLEREIMKLTRSELADFRQWFQEYDEAQLDSQIEDDALAGRFDCLSCRLQFNQLTPYKVFHPVELLAESYARARCS